MDPTALLKAVYAAMKPGAVVGVIDHVASPNSDTRATVEKLHRIDPERDQGAISSAPASCSSARSNMLRNPADDHSLLVFDPKIRGQDRPRPLQVQEAALSAAKAGTERARLGGGFRAY